MMNQNSLNNYDSKIFNREDQTSPLDFSTKPLFNSIDYKEKNEKSENEPELQHCSYEVTQLIDSIKIIREIKENEIVLLNALNESILLHSRILYEFYNLKEIPKKFKDEDLKAYQYIDKDKWEKIFKSTCSAQSSETELKETAEIIHKSLAHLSKKRLDYKPSFKNSKFKIFIIKILELTIEFNNLTDWKYLEINVKEDINKLIHNIKSFYGT